MLCKLPWASGGQKLGDAAWECRKRGVAVPTLLARVLTLALLYLAGAMLGGIFEPDGSALFAPVKGAPGLSLAGGGA